MTSEHTFTAIPDQRVTHEFFAKKRPTSYVTSLGAFGYAAVGPFQSGRILPLPQVSQNALTPASVTVFIGTAGAFMNMTDDGAGGFTKNSGTANLVSAQIDYLTGEWSAAFDIDAVTTDTILITYTVQPSVYQMELERTGLYVHGFVQNLGQVALVVNILQADDGVTFTTIGGGWPRTIALGGVYPFMIAAAKQHIRINADYNSAGAVDAPIAGGKGELVAYMPYGPKVERIRW